MTNPARDCHRLSLPPVTVTGLVTQYLIAFLAWSGLAMAYLMFKFWVAAGR
jgi:hypothetical protein